MELLTEFTGRPADTDASALLLDSLRTGTPVVSIAGMGGVGKTALALEYVRASQNSTDVRSLRRNIAEMDSLFDQLSNQATQGTVELALPILLGDSPPQNLSPSGEPSTSPTVPVSHAITVLHAPPEPPATSVVPLVDAADHPWSSALDFLLTSAVPLFSGRTNPLEPAPRSHYVAGGSAAFAAKLHVDYSSLTIDKPIIARLRQELLNLINRIRILLRIRLVRVLSRLSRFADVINFVLLLLAASRCYGRRAEPSDYTLPILTSMSVVIGEAARL